MRSKPVVILLSLLLVSATEGAARQAREFQRKLSNDQKIIHVLNRLTFGPRPGDSDRVRKLGVKKWIDRQLDPGRVQESRVLEEKLAPLKTLRMDAAEMTRAYPQRIATKRDPAAGSQEQMKAVLSDDQVRRLRTGTREDRLALLESLPRDRLDMLIASLPGNIRQSLLPIAPADLRRRLIASVAPTQVIPFDLTEAKLYRAVYSERQLAEVLTDFWYNHFNVFLDKGADRYLVTSYERDAIRPHILGKFKELLLATAEHPAMLFYLDNWQSVDPKAAQRASGPRGTAPRNVRGLNENYARELLELHTLGVDGGYSQKDVIEVARCFTGWTIRDPRSGGSFYFNDRMHDPDEKTVLGVKIPAGGGREDGLKVIDILVHHPSTARFVSRKLAQRFVADNPPDSLVERMAETFRRTDGDIRAVLKTMFDSREFWSEGAYRSKMKSPLELVASAVRAVNGDLSSAFALAGQVGQLGEPLYRKIEPTGYSNSGGEWVNTAGLLGRMNFALALASGRLPGVKADLASLPAAPKALAQAVLGAPTSAQTVAAMETGTDQSRAVAILLGSPEFQRR